MPLPVINYDRVLYYTRRFALSNMRSAVTVVRKPDPVFDPSTGELASAPPTLVYSGVARIAPISGPLTYILGDEPQPFSQVLVSIPADTADLPATDDLVTIVSHPGDPATAGRVFRVIDVSAGGQWMASRQMQAVGVQESPHWPHTTTWTTAGGAAAATGSPGALVGSP